jgi:hypothetical protein
MECGGMTPLWMSALDSDKICSDGQPRLGEPKMALRQTGRYGDQLI